MLLALTIDEQSLFTSKILGTAATYLSETLHSGGHYREQSWGGLPILIIAGDDYQLPGIGDGILNALVSCAGLKMTQIGRQTFLDCAQYVMDLGGSKHMNNSESHNRQLLNCLRTGEPNEKDVWKLMGLHLENIEKIHGRSKVDEIEDKTIFLFYRNIKRQQHWSEYRSCGEW